MIIAYIITYAAAFIAAKAGHDILSGIILILTAIAMYAAEYRRPHSFIGLRRLFLLGFLGGQGIACLKLSNIQSTWENMTWLCFFLGFVMFYLTFELLRINENKIIKRIPGDRVIAGSRLFACIVALTVISLLSFAAEALILGYIPLFVRGVPHAYSYFHISGVHYFTVSCVLVPSMSVIWFLKVCKDRDNDTGRIRLITVAVCSVTALLIPVLCVSRFQIVFAIVMAAFTYVTVGKPLPVKWVLITGAAAIGAFALLSIARSHDAEYLNSIFEMKPDLPVDISRVYVYIANNYDNFDCMVRELPEYTWGLRQLFPVFALTGLKFIFPQLVSLPLYVTKPELTTLTVIYDFYYDFGAAGVCLGSAVLGAVAFFAEFMTKKRNDPMLSLVYSQLAIYMALAFFTTWFSNPTTWFYFAVTAIVYFVSTRAYTSQ